MIMADKEGFSTGTVDFDVYKITSWYGKHFKTLTQIMRIQESLYSERKHKYHSVNWDEVFKKISRRLR
jgi:hypothetical protein